MKDDIAVIMAAGTGTRMLPLTETTAKPLIPVRGIPMIETVMNALTKRGVGGIYIVVGYKKEQFEYLTRKYANVTLIENREYLQKNNLSSIKAAEHVLGNNNCFICEADLFISDETVLERDFTRSCYLGKLVEGFSEDWVFETECGRITRIKKGGTDLYNMAGISYWLKYDIAVIAKAVSAAYWEPGHEKLLWDEVVDRELSCLNVSVCPVEPGQIVELDTAKELEEFFGHPIIQ